MSDLPHRHVQDADSPERSIAKSVFAAFARAMHAHRQLMMRRLAEHGAHPGQMFCIKALTEHDGITQRDIAELLHVARPTVTVMLQKMETAGLVERRVDERDQRYTRTYLTEAGWAMHGQIHGILDEMVDSAVGPMPTDDQRELARLLGTLADNLQTASDAMSPSTDGNPRATNPAHAHLHPRPSE